MGEATRTTPTRRLRFLRSRLAAVAFAFVSACLGPAAMATQPALAPPGNLSDLWWVPEESGWGLSLVQHDERVLFGVLYVYAESGRAQWFVMPEMRRADAAAPSFTGTLYSSSGSPAGTPFDPAATRLVQRGEATVTPLPDGRATLRYSVDGAPFEKSIRRLDVAQAPIEGIFTVRLASASATACPEGPLLDGEAWRIRRVAGGHDITRLPPGGIPGVPQPLQVRQHGSAVIATFEEPLSPARGTWALVLDSVTGFALTGKVTFSADAPAGGCAVQGTLSGARDFPLDAPGGLSDLWFDPTQPGWGMTVIHGGFGLFGVLYLYSADTRDGQGLGPGEWYVLPEMRPLPFPGGAVPDPPPPPPGYAGTLYAAQGSPFAQRFDPAATRLVPVGEATLGVSSTNAATLTYRIGARTVERQVQRFETAALPLAGRYRVNMNPFITSCGVRATTSETWDIERAADGRHVLSRRDASGTTLGAPVPVQLVQGGKLARITFPWTQAGIVDEWTVSIEHAGAGGLGGAFVRQRADRTCYENGTLAGAREP